MAETIQLPKPEGPDMPLGKAVESRRSRRSYGEGGLNLEQVSEILYSAAGITDPGGRFRAAPSAGATYPMDTYIVAGEVEGLDPGIYKYLETEHSLEPVKEGVSIEDVADAALGQSALSEASAIIALFGIYERTTGRYGDRGVRYVHMEAGHIGQNVHLVCEGLDLSTVMVGAFHDDKVSALFGVPGTPLYLMPLGPRE